MISPDSVHVLEKPLPPESLDLSEWGGGREALTWRTCSVHRVFLCTLPNQQAGRETERGGVAAPAAPAHSRAKDLQSRPWPSWRTWSFCFCSGDWDPVTQDLLFCFLRQEHSLAIITCLHYKHLFIPFISFFFFSRFCQG